MAEHKVISALPGLLCARIKMGLFKDKVKPTIDIWTLRHRRHGSGMSPELVNSLWFGHITLSFSFFSGEPENHLPRVQAPEVVSQFARFCGIPMTE